MSTRQGRLSEGAAPLTLAPSQGEPELPGMAEWRARQKKRAEAELLTRELGTFQDDACAECGYTLPGHDWACSHVPAEERRAR